MSTYRFGRWKQWDGVIFYNIEKKTFFGWKEQNYWTVGNDLLSETVDFKKKDKKMEKMMMNAVERLIKVGHTVI